MRFLHTADLHLGCTPDKDRPWGPSRAAAVRSSLLRLMDVCREEEIDLLLIAGDLFDAPPVVRELSDVNFLFSGLPHTKVVLIAGDRDFVRPGSAYKEYRFCPQVTFLSSSEPDSVFFPQWNLEVHGMSYDARELPDNRLESLEAPRDGRRHFLLAHGGDEKHLPVRASVLGTKGWDYVAMGHLHKPAITPDGRLAFPGSPEPLCAEETGDHGFCIGTLRPGEFSVSWHSFSDFEYTNLTVNMAPDMTMTGLENLIRRRSSDSGREVLNIRLTGRRDPGLTVDKDALLRVPGVASVEDESHPDCPWTELKKRPVTDLTGRFIREMSREQGEETEDDAAIRQDALEYGACLLLKPLYAKEVE